MNDNGHKFGLGLGLRMRPAAWMHSHARKLLAAGLGCALAMLVGCGPVKLVASTNIPPPLVMKVPIGVALFMPTEFSSYVHKEERWSTKWHIELGKAQSDGITRLMGSMFERVVTVDSVNAGTQVPGGVAAILEPSIEEYAFVTPRDAGSPFYAVSIKYRVNVYLPDGKLADSWGFTGYGTSPSQGLSSDGPLSAATALAMRDAGAKLAVEFREQAVMRGLVPGAPTADAPAESATPAAPGSTTPPSEAPPVTETPSNSTTPGATTPPSATPTETPSNSTAPAGTPPPAAPPTTETPAAPEANQDAAKDAKDPANGEPSTENKDGEGAAAEPTTEPEKKIPKQPIEPEAFALGPPVS